MDDNVDFFSNEEDLHKAINCMKEDSEETEPFNYTIYPSLPYETDGGLIFKAASVTPEKDSFTIKISYYKYGKPEEEQQLILEHVQKINRFNNCDHVISYHITYMPDEDYFKYKRDNLTIEETKFNTCTIKANCRRKDKNL